MLTAPAALTQVDTTAYNRPARALQRAVVPGMGQLYNRHYLKLPLVYAGLGAFAGGAILVNRQYLLYRHAYLYTARRERDGTPTFPEYATDYAKLIEDLGLTPEAHLSTQEVSSRRARLEPHIRRHRDTLRRNRDLLYIGVAMWYGLSILDAFISAHLLDFDVSEQLTLSVRGGAGAMTMHITF